MTDAEFLSKRLARVAKLAGVPMPDFSHEGIAEVAGTILGQIASKLEFDRAQDAQVVRNAALEEVKQLCRKWSSTAWIIPEISALQSAPAQPVERPDGVELPPMPGWAFRDDLGGLVPSEVRTALREYALAAIATNQPQRVNAQEPVAEVAPNCGGTLSHYITKALPVGTKLYAAAPQSDAQKRNTEKGNDYG